MHRINSNDTDTSGYTNAFAANIAIHLSQLTPECPEIPECDGKIYMQFTFFLHK